MNERIPKVRMAKPTGRPIQLRYTDPATGREIRITTKTHDPLIAADEKAKLEAKLLLGIDAKPRRRKGGPSMAFEEFRERYRTLRLDSLRDKSAAAAETRLDIAERIVKPRTLADLATAEALHDLQAKLLLGEGQPEGEPNQPRAKFTVRGYMAAIVAALNWAETMGWLPAVPKLQKIRVAKLKSAKGRPLSDPEFGAMIEAVAVEVGELAADSWKFILRGMRESGMRLEEMMHLHWSDRRYIVPSWSAEGLPILSIPAAMQKNDCEEAIPLLPGFEELLLETPEPERFGWVFNPMSLQTRLGRRVRHQRPNAEWVGKVVSRIGKRAGVVVGVDGKFASSHDLRRTCAERLADADVPEREVAKILRHADVKTTRRYYAPGTVQASANIIRERLSL